VLFFEAHSLPRAAARPGRPLSTEWEKDFMPLVRYRLKTPTLALLEDDGRHVARTVPAGAVVVANGASDDDKLIEVQWDGQKLMMFVQDLRSRAELTE
jgi:hypothetical protein